MMPHKNQTPKENKDLTGIISEPKPEQKPDLTDQTLQKQQVNRDDATEPEEQHKPEEQHEIMRHENETPKENKDLTGIVSDPKPDQKPDLADQTLKKQQGRDDPTEPEEYHDMMLHENQTSKDIKHLTNIISEVEPDQKLDLTNQTLQKQPEDRNDATEPEEHHGMMPHKYQTPTGNKDLTGIVSEPKPKQKSDLTDQTLQKQQDIDDPTELEEHYEPEEQHEMMT